MATIAPPDTPQVQLASFAPPALPLDGAVADDDTVAPSAAAKPEVASLRALVDAVAELPSIDLDAQLRCLAGAIYFEAKGEPLEGQLAVAEVILNRVESGRYASSICGVVTQRGQFSFVRGGRMPTPSDSRHWRVAQAVAVIAATDNWKPVVGDATSFHATRVAPGWRGLRRVSQIGNHVFYAAR